MDVPDDMYYSDPGQDLLINLKKGYQLLDGAKSEQFVRFRYGYAEGDVGRVNAQKLFLAALLKQAKQSINISSISKIAGIALDNITTDIKLADSVYFAKNLLTVDLSKVSMMTMPGRSANNGLSYYVMYRNAALETVNKYLNVYNIDITNTNFDKNTVFCSPEQDNIYNVYYTKFSAGNIITADNPDIDLGRVY